MQQVEARRTFAHPAHKVWRLTGEFGGLQNWLPGVVGCEVHGTGARDQNGNAERSVTLMDGSVTREALQSLDEAAMRYSYAILAAKGFTPDSRYIGHFQVRELNPDQCEILWQAEFSVPAEMPADKVLKLKDKVQTMYGFFLLHLDSVLAGK